MMRSEALLRTPGRGIRAQPWHAAMLVHLLAALACTACGARTTRPADVPPLEERLRPYLELRAEAVAAVGGAAQVARQAAVATRVDALAAEIQARRQHAATGEVISPPAADAIRHVLDMRLKEPDGPALRAAVREIQPNALSPQVNERYPEDEPRATTPPSLLAVLPALPSELAFRFVGRDLVLLDRYTGVVVDVVRDALPAME